jgi:hypothetical protein
MNPTGEKFLLDKHKELLKNAEKFKCNSCAVVYDQKDAHGPFLWKPASKMTQRLANGRAATFVLCPECSRLPDEETRPKIEAGLAKYGLFG